MNLYAIILLTAFSAVVTAAPGMVEQAHPVAHRSTNTTCVPGTPTSISGYDFTYAAFDSTGSYDIEPGFSSGHSIGSPMNLFSPHNDGENVYDSFKCQFTCNGTPGCVSFFGRFVDVDSDSERYECLGFDALLDGSSFVQSTGNLANGAYNKLCG